MKRRIIAFVTVTLLVFAFAIPTLASDEPAPAPPPTGDTQSSLTPGQIVTISSRSGMTMNVAIGGVTHEFTVYPASAADVNSAQYRLYELVSANPQMQGSQQVRTFRFNPSGLTIPAGGSLVIQINVPGVVAGGRYMALYSADHGATWSELVVTVAADGIANVRFTSLNSLVSIVRLTGGGPRSPQTGQ